MIMMSMIMRNDTLVYKYVQLYSFIFDLHSLENIQKALNIFNIFDIGYVNSIGSQECETCRRFGL